MLPNCRFWVHTTKYCTVNQQKVRDRNLSEVLYVPYLLPIYFSISLPRFPAKVILLLRKM